MDIRSVNHEIRNPEGTQCHCWVPTPGGTIYADFCRSVVFLIPTYAIHALTKE